MRRISYAAFCLAWLPVAAHAEESLSPQLVTAIKAATVFVKIKWNDMAGSGSGFVVRVDGDTAYIVTNRHVIEPKVAEIVVERHGRPRDHFGPRGGFPGFPQPPFPFPVPGQEEEPRYSARVVVREFKNVNVTAVFQSGTTHEESVPGKVVAIDPDEDLAVVKVSGVKQPPKTIDYREEPQLAETMPVYVFGFPLGDELSTGKRSPAITVGKGTISSLRTDDDGNLALVQVDAALNHGNSGGPVVNAQGRLVGVAVARITDDESQNLGMAIPSRAVARLLRGRVEKAVLTAVKDGDNKVSIEVKAAVIDPLNAIKSVKLQYLSATAVTDKPKPIDSLEKIPGCHTLELKVQDGVASGKISLKKGITEVSLLHQSVSIDDSGKPAVASSEVKRVALALPQPGPPPVQRIAQVAANPGPLVITGQKAAARPGGSIGLHFDGNSTPFLGTGGVVPMSNWNNYTGANFSGAELTDNRGAKSGVTFSLVNAPGWPWSTGSRNELLNGYLTAVNFQPMTLTLNGIHYSRYSIYVYVGDATLHDEAKVTINGTTYYYSPMGGQPVGYTRVTSTKPTTHELGNYIEVDGLSGGSQTITVGGSTQQYGGLCSVEIVDTSNDTGAAKTPPATRPGVTAIPDSSPNNPTPSRPVVASKVSARIAGSAFGTEFRDVAPENGILVGFDVALSKWGGVNDIIGSIRPIFIDEHGKEILGKQQGGATSLPLQVRAKPGYAVGAITTCSVAALDGFSVTFMKIERDHLNPNDKYESDWVGGGGARSSVSTSGNGKPGTGIVGYVNGGDLCGFGVIFSGAITNSPDALGKFVLSVETAELRGSSMVLRDIAGVTNICGWNNPNYSVMWKVAFAKPGTYTVTANIANAYAPSSMTLQAGDSKATAIAPTTGSWSTYNDTPVGKIEIKKAGVLELTLLPTPGENWQIVDLRRLILTPTQ